MIFETASTRRFASGRRVSGRRQETPSAPKRSRMGGFASIFAFLWATAVGFAAPQEPETQPTSEPAATQKSEAEFTVEPASQPTLEDEVYEISGSMSLNFRGRYRGDDNDEDLFTYIALDGGDPAVNDVTFHFYGRANYDLDGDSGRGTNPFSSLNDSFSDDLDIKVYEAYVDLNRVLDPTVVRRVRLGRQNVYAGYSYLLDGVRFDFMPAEPVGNMEVSIFGGVPEYLYDSSRSGDWMVGTDLKFHPWDDTFLLVRYAHVGDENDSSGRDRDFNDDFASLAWRQRFTKEVQFSAEWNTIDADTRDVALRLSWTNEEGDMSIRANYRYENTVLDEFTAAYDLYVGLLLKSHAHHVAGLEFSTVIEEHFGIDTGFSIRELADDGDEGPFNREYARGFLTLSAQKWPIDEIDFALTGEIWEADGDDVLSAGGEIRLRPEENIRITLGSFYSRYKYDLFVVDEREDATTIFLGARWQISREFRLDGRYEFETGDEGDFHTFTLGLTWRF